MKPSLGGQPLRRLQRAPCRGPTRTADRERRGPSAAGLPAPSSRSPRSSPRADGRLQPRPPIRAAACLRSVALEQQHLGRAARRGLEAERAAAGKGVEAAPARQVVAEPVEQASREPGPASGRSPGRSGTGSLLRFHWPPMMRTSAGGAAAWTFGANRLPCPCSRLHSRTAMPSRASSALAWPTVNSP